jgi:tRNA-dihydrouridine synthase A
MLGLWNGTPGARRWRQVWSDHRLKAEAPARVAGLAHQARLASAGAARGEPLAATGVA